MRKSMTKVSNIGFGVALLVLAGIALVSYRSIRRVADAVEARRNAVARQDLLQDLLPMALDVEAGERDYVITGNTQFLEPFQAGKMQMEPQLRRIRAALADKPGEQPELEKLEAEATELVSQATQLVSLKTNNDDPSLNYELASGRVKRVMDQLRQSITMLSALEYDNAQQEFQKLRAGLRWNMLSIVTGCEAAFVVLGLVAWAMNRSLRERSRLNAELGQAREQLEDRVRQRTAELIETAEKLHKNEQRFRSLVEATTAIVWITPASGQVESEMNDWAAFTGQSQDQIKGAGWLDAVHPEDRKHTALAWTEALAHNAMYKTEYRLRNSAGEYRQMMVRGVPVFDQERQIREWVGTCTDITDVKQVEAEIRKQKELLQNVIDHIPCAVAWKDRNCVNIGANQLAARDLGYASAAEMLGKGNFELPISKEEAEFFTRCDREVMETGQPLLDIHEILTTPQGARMELLTKKVPLHDLAGEVIGVLVVYMDITESKRAQEVLECAKKAAETANRAKSDFLANMSHEIRTPMNGILGMTELTLDTNLTREQRENLGMVKASADSLLQLIDDILDFSKIEAGKLELDPSPFGLRDTLGDTVKALGPRAWAKGLEMICHIEPAVPDNLVGDALRLRQIVTNLVGNAIKFTERGEIVVHVGLLSAESKVPGEILPRAEDSAVEVLHFSVRDTGLGIPVEKQHMIFEAFTQADSSTTRHHGGTGLGLTITAQLLNLMGGHVWVESEVGHGSTFHFTIPLQQASAPPTKSLAGPVDLEMLPVLVVDDNVTNRFMLKAVLTNWRMRPVAVGDGASAVAIMKKAATSGDPFPLVLLDADMPALDGFAIARQIKSEPALAGATIMMLSSIDQTGDAFRCRQLGVTCYVRKPIAQSELFDAILTALGSEPFQDQASIPGSPPPPQANSTSPQPAPRVGASQGGQSLRVLLAEDNAINQALVVKMLQKRGHSVVVAGDGRQALAVLDSQAIDLVLMDIQMPEMDGFAATAAIREREKSTGAHIPIAALTAHAMKGDRERCLAAGMDDYLSKPLRTEELMRLIARLSPITPSNAPSPESAANATQTGSVFDPALAIHRFEGDLDFFLEIVGLFLAQDREMLPRIRSAVERGDALALERATHKLKGSMVSFEDERASAAAARLEKIARAGELDLAAEALASLEQEMHRLREALISFQAQTPATR